MGSVRHQYAIFDLEHPRHAPGQLVVVRGHEDRLAPRHQPLKHPVHGVGRA